ncbi:Clp protease N-terminal domain-containing protein [Streptomyces sp. NPDC004609]|uniref:Clp protease N-terminal domain-containing protein n=1 Tax=Streptomyces sp. NPDC004609 TaxID=3364704 RepID=UPI0036AF4D0E
MAPLTGDNGESRAPAIVEPDRRASGLLGAARGAAGGRGSTIGTEHLLAAVVGTKGAAREALSDAGAAATLVLAVLSDREERDEWEEAWDSTDDEDGRVDSVAVLGESGDRCIRLSGAAARALRAAMRCARGEGAEEFTAVHVLRGLLAEEGNRARELLRTCEADPADVLRALDGEPVTPAERVGPLLRPTRDALLGRTPYPMSFWRRFLTGPAANWASVPLIWIGLEVREQARRLGDRAIGTEHLLLAVLATHEVGLRYPQLTGPGTGDPDTRYAGGASLAARGIDYAAVHAALTTRGGNLGSDARPAEKYLRRTRDGGTAALVTSLLAEEARARRLLGLLER